MRIAAVNRVPSLRRRRARRAKAAQATEPRPRASSSGRCPGSPGASGAPASRAVVARVAASAGIRREAEAPSLSQLVRIDEARAAADVATEVERGERRPVGAVAEEIFCDAPERVARPHRVGRVARRVVASADVVGVQHCGESGAVMEDRARWSAGELAPAPRRARGVCRSSSGRAHRRRSVRPAGRGPTSPGAARPRRCAHAPRPPAAAAHSRRPRPPRPPGRGGTAQRAAAAASRARDLRPVDCRRSTTSTAGTAVKARRAATGRADDVEDPLRPPASGRRYPPAGPMVMV